MNFFEFKDETNSQINVNAKKVNIYIFFNSVVAIVAFFAFVGGYLGIFDAKIKMKDVYNDIAKTTEIKDKSISGDIVTALGIGETKEKALLDAKRMAVEKRLGVFIVSDTKIKGLVAVKDEIEQHSLGYVSDLRLLDEKEKDGSWQIRISCKVNSYKMWEKIEDKINKDEEIQKLFRHQSIVVLPKEDVIEEKRKAGVEEIVNSVKNTLLDKGFIIRKENIAKALYKEILEKFNKYISKELSEEFKDLSNEFIILVDLEKSDEGVKAVASATDLLNYYIAKLSAPEVKVDKLVSKSDWEKAARASAIELNKKILKKLIERISEDRAASNYTLFFRNFSNDKYSNILTAIGKLPYLTTEGKEIRADNLLRVDNLKYDGKNFISNLETVLKSIGIIVDIHTIGSLVIIMNADVILGVRKKTFIISLSVFIMFVALILLVIVKKKYKKKN